MDWSNFFAWLAGVVGTRAYFWMRGRLTLPYKWKCPKCEFKMSMSYRSDILEKVGRDHLQSFHS